MTDTPNNPATDQARTATTAEGGTPSLARLLKTYTAWSGRNVLLEAARNAEATGDGDRAEALRLLAGGDTSAPSAIDALHAQHELASLLQGWRWQTVAAAREHGATWTEIGRATRRDPTEELADYLAAVDQQARFGYLDDQRINDYRAAADIPDSDEADPDVDEAERWRGRPAAPDPLAPDPVYGHPEMPADLAGLDETELLALAEHRDAAARRGTGEERVAAGAELDAASREAERRAENDGPDSVPAQVAGYISLLREDTDHALADEAASWRADLRKVLLEAASTPPPPPSSAAPDAPSAQMAANVARDVDAGMQAPLPGEHDDRPDGAGTADGAGGFDMERLDQVTADHGYAVLDLTAAGGVRGPSAVERADLDRASTVDAGRRDRAEDFVEGAGVGVTGFDPKTGTYSDLEIGSRSGLGERLRGLEALEALASVAEADLAHSPPDAGHEDAVSAQDGYLDCRITGPNQHRASVSDRGSRDTPAGAEAAQSRALPQEAPSPDALDVPGVQQRIDRMRARLAAEQHHHAASERVDRRGRLAHWNADLAGLDDAGPLLDDSPTHLTADGPAEGDAS